MATHPLELVHLDYLCLEPGKCLEEIVLGITDHFTRYTQAYVTPTQTTQTTVKTLWDKLIVHYGLPKKILLDQGRNFESQLVADLCMLMGTQKLQTSWYHPQTNGQCEISTPLCLVCWECYPQRRNQSGRTTLECRPCLQLYLEFSYRVHPHYLMYRRQPCLPVDVTLGLAPHSVTVPTTSKIMQKI